MALTLVVNYTGTNPVDGSQGSLEATISPNADAVLAAAKKVGYREQTEDPAVARQVELKMAELLQSEPNSEERVNLQAELRSLQTLAGRLVPNPVGAEEFVVGHVRGVLESLLIDDEAIQRSAQEKIDQETAAAKAAAANSLQLNVTPRN